MITNLWVLDPAWLIIVISHLTKPTLEQRGCSAFHHQPPRFATKLFRYILVGRTLKICSFVFSKSRIVLTSWLNNCNNSREKQPFIKLLYAHTIRVTVIIDGNLIIHAHYVSFHILYCFTRSYVMALVNLRYLFTRKRNKCPGGSITNLISVILYYYIDIPIT